VSNNGAGSKRQTHRQDSAQGVFSLVAFRYVDLVMA
jgi:hypothetical protein